MSFIIAFIAVVIVWSMINIGIAIFLSRKQPDLPSACTGRCEQGRFCTCMEKNRGTGTNITGSSTSDPGQNQQTS